MKKIDLNKPLLTPSKQAYSDKGKCILLRHVLSTILESTQVKVDFRKCKNWVFTLYNEEEFSVDDVDLDVIKQAVELSTLPQINPFIKGQILEELNGAILKD